jgi:hypothetical protein
MNTSSLPAWRRYAQITLAIVAVLSAAGAGFRYLVRGGSIFGEHLVVTPSAGPVGLHPRFEFQGFDGDREVTVYLCAGTTGGVEDCASLGKGKPGEPLTAKAIPRELPDTTEVKPGTYVLRAGPDDDGNHPQRGEFEVVPFKVGTVENATSFANASVSDLEIGEPARLATGVPCRPPSFLADGRLVAGSTVVDARHRLRIDFDIQALQLEWSPVGDKLAILTSDRKEIRLAAPDGQGAVTKVREARGLLSSMSWSPDGDRLAFISENDPATRGGPGPPTVRILNATNGSLSSAGPGLQVAWSPDPDVLAVQMSGGVIQSSSPGGARKALTTGTDPSWSHDGRFLAVSRTEGTQTRGFIVPAQGGGGAAVTGSGGCAMSFAPDGKALAVVSNAGTTTALQFRPLRLKGAPAEE